MKLVKQKLLYFQEGSSDKVYEVDLCEVGQNRYVVNFRYGKRGANLKEGTKTDAPVALANAQRIFDDLVDSKVKKGYQETAAGAAPPPKPAKVRSAAAVVPVDADARNQAVLNRLAARSGKWPLERAIWRAGELKLKQATPLLLKLIGSVKDPLRDYCIAWALGWCGDETAVSALGKLYTDRDAHAAVRRIAGEALLKLSDDDTRAEFRQDMIGKLPESLRALATHGPATEFARALKEYLANANHEQFAVLDTIYLIDNEHVRPALIELLQTAPLRPNYFQRIRHIFKAAEYRRDAEVFGLLARRFDVEKPMFNNWYKPYNSTKGYHNWLYINGTYVQNADKEIKKPNAPIAFGGRTRNYLRRRVWRTLNRLGQLGDTDYVKMAVGVLLAYSDADAQPVRQGSYQSYETSRAIKFQFDQFAPYLAFNHILYENSPRYVLKKGTVTWRCHKYRPGDPVPDTREEAYPKVWEQVPVGLLHLLSESQCHPVHHFAVKALRACKQFCAELDNDAILMLLSRPYEVTARLGFELAKEHYNPNAPDRELAVAVANCAFAEARAQAQRWISDKREFFLQDSNTVVALVASDYEDTRAFTRNLLTSMTFMETMARALVAKLIAHLVGFTEAQADKARDVAETIFKAFGPQLRTIGMRAVKELLAHPLVAVQELGGQILLNMDKGAGEADQEIMLALINSAHAPIRAIGVKLLGQLPAERLKAQARLLLALAMHAREDIRSAVRPIIQRLGNEDREFGRGLVAVFIEALLAPEASEGVHNSMVRMMAEDLPLEAIDYELAIKLTQSPSLSAKELGGTVIKRNLEWAEQFTTSDIIKLANNDALVAREAAQALFKRVASRYQRDAGELGVAIRLFDNKWDEARAQWFEIFSTTFSAEHWRPEILVAICDSVREDVRKFGRDLITRYFQEQDGQLYLLRLSEHPSVDLQMFATNYLERFAADSPERLEHLTFYFTSVLSRVNRARVAKQRVLAFLTAEAVKSVEAARVVAGILERQSLTMAIGDKAKAIEAMLKIRAAYPEVPLPLSIKPVEVRRGI